MKLHILLCASALLAGAPSAHATPHKDALDGFQFDGVTSDALLKGAHQTRRDWLDQNPKASWAYWKAWECKGQPCDSKWQQNIRAKAALVPRTDKDPKQASGASSSGH
jgi:hypothetical protein